MWQENNKTKENKGPQGLLLITKETCFPSLTRCQSDSLCSKSSGFTQHPFLLIIGFLILHLMMQPGLEDSYYLYCSPRMTDRCTMSLWLPFFSRPVTHDPHPSGSRGPEHCSLFSSTPCPPTQPCSALGVLCRTSSASSWISSPFFFPPTPPRWLLCQPGMLQALPCGGPSISDWLSVWANICHAWTLFWACAESLGQIVLFAPYHTQVREILAVNPLYGQANWGTRYPRTYSLLVPGF